MSNPNFGKETTAEEVATALKDDIKGKNILLVGATVKSLGAEFLRVVAPYAKTIWVAGRSKERLQEAVDEALKPIDGLKPTIHLVEMDMTSFESIRNAAAKINAQQQPIDVIVQNIMIRQHEVLQRSVEGFEAQFAGNHLGTFLLVSLILPRLRQSGPGARIVAVSSTAHVMEPFRWDDPNYELRPEEYECNSAYGHTKLANVLFTKEIAKRLAGENILAFTLHPGVIITNGALAVPKRVWIKFGGMFEDGTFNPALGFKSIPQGAATYVVAAFDPILKDHSGAYLDDCQIRNDKLAPTVNDEDAVRLWAMTEDMVGIKLL